VSIDLSLKYDFVVRRKLFVHRNEGSTESPRIKADGTRAKLGQIDPFEIVARNPFTDPRDQPVEKDAMKHAVDNDAFCLNEARPGNRGVGQGICGKVAPFVETGPGGFVEGRGRASIFPENAYGNTLPLSDRLQPIERSSLDQLGRRAGFRTTGYAERNGVDGAGIAGSSGDQVSLRTTPPPISVLT
jgi:hypothetical protein